MKPEVAFSKQLVTLSCGNFCLPPKKLFGKSVLGWSNILFFQWLFLRVWWNIDSNGLNIGITGFVVPLTGWWSDYRWIGKWR